MFTIFEPKAFPTATPMLSVMAAKIDTESADGDVQKATNINPTVVFFKPSHVSHFYGVIDCHITGFIYN